MPKPPAAASKPSSSRTSSPDLRPAWLLLLGASLALATAGCAGYKLGPSNSLAARSQSLQVNPFRNETIEPRLSAAVTSSLRRNLQQDGTFRLDTHNQGDIVVTGVIREYDRSGLSVRPEDVLTPRDYQISMAADVKAVERATDRVLLERTVIGRTTVRIGSDLASAERQAIPLAADDLARRVTDLLVDGVW